MTGVSMHALLPLLVVAVAYGGRQQALAARLRDQVERVAGDTADPATGLLTRAAFPLRLEPELGWARLQGVRVGLIVFVVLGSRPERAARALGGLMRGHENAFVLAPGRFLVELWAVDRDALRLAVARLGDGMHRAGFPVVYAGAACFPDDGDEVGELLRVCDADPRPVRDWQREAAGEQLPEPWSAGPLTRAYDRARAPLAGLAVAVACWLVGFVVLPWAVSVESPRSGPGLVAALLAVAVYAWLLAAGLRASWELADGRVPHVAQLVDRRTAAAAAAASIALATGVLLPSVPLPVELYGPVLVLDVAIVAVLAHGRHLVRLRAGWLAGAAVAVVALLAATYGSSPALADAVRILLAVLLGAAGARAVERLWWVMVASVIVTAVDLWSVFAASGVTRQLAGDVASTGTASGVFDALALAAPEVDGAPLFLLGTTDLAFASFLICVAHLWRLGVGRTVLAVVVGLELSSLAATIGGTVIPVLPALAAAFVAVHWPSLRGDVRAELRSDPAS